MQILGFHIISDVELRRQIEAKADTVLRALTSDFMPDIEQVVIAMKAAKVGASSHGRRLKKRKVLRALYKLRQRMGLIEEAA